MSAPQQCQVVPGGPSLVIWWLNGLEMFPLWIYSPAANSYTEMTPGLAGGRATVAAGPDTAFAIQGSPCLQGSDGTVQAAAFSEYGGVGGGAQPQLQFFAGHKKVGTLSAAGLRVTAITEGAPAAGNLFQIYAGGILAGTISSAGLLAMRIEEVSL